MLKRKNSLALKDMFLKHRLIIYVDSVTRMKTWDKSRMFILVTSCNNTQLDTDMARTRRGTTWVFTHLGQAHGWDASAG